MQEINLSALDGISRALEAMPELRRDALRNIAEQAKAVLAVRIGGTGRVAGWQGVYEGSGGGYAAVRAAAGKYLAAGGKSRYSMGHVTNAIESGHGIRRPSGQAKRYRSRVRTAAVRGKYMYRDTGAELNRLAEQEAKALGERLASALDGRAV